MITNMTLSDLDLIFECIYPRELNSVDRDNT